MLFLLYYLNIFDLGLLCIAHDSMKYLLKKGLNIQKKVKNYVLINFPYKTIT